MKKENLLLQQLIRYSQSDHYPFHMPGHKRRVEFPNPFSIDITEIEGFDNLHHPTGILQESMAWAAAVYGSDRTYYLVNGSSAGILSAVCATVSFGGTLLMSRNCHKAVYHGVILNRLKTSYVYPQIIQGLGIQGGISPAVVDQMLEEQPEVEAVLIVSPTYEGVVSDIRAIAEVVHRRGIPLIVDEAHGAHFSFSSEIESAISCGADLVIQSLHKTLPSFTQTAVLHVKQGAISIGRLERYLQMFQSSSPSYLLMAGIEACIYEMASEAGKQQIQDYDTLLKTIRRQLQKMQMLQLLDQDICGSDGVFALDETKIVVSCRGCCRQEADGTVVVMDGNYFSEWLRREYHLEMEMCGADYVVAITTCVDTREGLRRLVQALLEIDKQLFPESMIAAECGISVSERMVAVENKMAAAKSKIILAEAMDRPTENLLLEHCVNRISAEFIYLYPPGIPLVAPGEYISEAVMEQLMRYREMGLSIQGMEDHQARVLKVIK